MPRTSQYAPTTPKRTIQDALDDALAYYDEHHMATEPVQISPREQAVAAAARKAARARLDLEAAIRSAHADGLPLRTIAAAAGISHEQVRRIAS